ncbi:MAG TPA: hypothetical protein VEH55_11635 [Gaiellaceae bacterium]|nr:hypothetical protein [Gaiellaceae bacterium]
MNEERRRPLTLAALATVGLGVALGVRPVSVSTILAAYVLVLTAITLAALARSARSAAEWQGASEFEQALHGAVHTPVRPPELVRTERDITLGAANAGHLHARLLPILREVASARLAAHHNVELGRRPEAARALLGEEAWQLLRPDLPPPDDRNAAGLPLRRIRVLVDTLERL